MARAALLSIGALVVACSAASVTEPATVSPVRVGCPVLPAFDSVELMRDIFRLADDSMRGRRAGSPDGAKARDFIAARFDALGLALVGASRIRPFPITSPRFPPGSRGFNVVGVVPGTRFPDQYLVITAHYDHLGVGRPVNGDSIYNGADDNGSGTTGLLQLARWFAKHPAAHALLFVAMDAEELGDVGSRAFVNDPPVPLDRMLLNVNMDMVGRNAKNELYASGLARNPGLRPLIDSTIACSPITLRIGHDSGGPGDDWTYQSDQGAFHDKGIPHVYFGEEDHPDYHRPSDTPDRLMPGFFIGSLRTVEEFIRRFDAAPVSREAARRPTGG